MLPQTRLKSLAMSAPMLQYHVKENRHALTRSYIHPDTHTHTHTCALHSCLFLLLSLCFYYRFVPGDYIMSRSPAECRRRPWSNIKILNSTTTSFLSSLVCLLSSTLTQCPPLLLSCINLHIVIVLINDNTYDASSFSRHTHGGACFPVSLIAATAPVECAANFVPIIKSVGQLAIAGCCCRSSVCRQTRRDRLSPR